MKLLTNIKPRADGVVYATGCTGTKYAFRDDGTGILVADVADQRDVAQLLELEAFEPADEADFEAAEALLEAGKAALADDASDDLDFDDDPDAPLPAPLEANTPPVTDDGEPAKPAGKKGAGRRARG